MKTLPQLRDAAKRELTFRGIDAPETVKHVSQIVATVCGDDWNPVHVILAAESYLYQPLDGTEN